MSKANPITEEDFREFFDESIPYENDPIWDEYVGMREEALPWFMTKK